MRCATTLMKSDVQHFFMYLPHKSLGFLGLDALLGVKLSEFHLKQLDVTMLPLISEECLIKSVA